MTPLDTAILLKRDPADSTVAKKLTATEAVEYIKSVDFCNPHLLVKNSRKTLLRKKFFQEFFSHVETYLVNTMLPPIETHKVIKEILKVT